MTRTNNTNAIKQLPLDSRPYEKYKRYGMDAMTDVELLAIMLRSGTSGQNCIKVAESILSTFGSCSNLKNISVQELKKIKGIGEIKALQIKTLAELSRRIYLEKVDNFKVGSPKDVDRLFRKSLEDKKTEEMHVIMLNAKNNLISTQIIAKGSVNRANISMKEVLAYPIKELATSIIIVHNHPSGDSTPSKADLSITKKIVDYSSVFDIALLDHIVIAKEGYTSIKEQNPLLFVKGENI